MKSNPRVLILALSTLIFSGTPAQTSKGVAYRIRSEFGSPVQATGFKAGAVLINCRNDRNEVVDNFGIEKKALKNHEADFEGKKSPNWCSALMSPTVSTIKVANGATAKLPSKNPAFISCFKDNGEYASNFSAGGGILQNSKDGNLTCAYDEMQVGDIVVPLKAGEKTKVKGLQGDVHPLISCFRKTDFEFTHSLTYDLTTGEILSYDSDVSCLVRIPAQQTELKQPATATSKKSH
jgi:hypothetical protein